VTVARCDVASRHHAEAENHQADTHASVISQLLVGRDVRLQ
jgi:hypothetical protein